MRHRKHLLFIKHADSSFIKVDQRIIEKKYNVRSFLINPRKSKGHFIIRMLKLTIFLLWNAPRSVGIVTWFGDYHATIITIIGKITGTKVIIFAGGQEAICYPELKKGVYCNKLRGRCVKFALRNASVIIPNHLSLVYHENYYYTDNGKKDGISYYVPGIKTPITIIPNGIDPVKYFWDSSMTKVDNTVLTVGTMNNLNDFLNKGFDLFVVMARENPDLNFTLVGIREKFLPWIEEKYRVGTINNLRLILSYCPDDILINEYRKAKVFVQASITEGMPNTLNEAMLCGCIPVGSNVNGIPDAIGDTGVIVYKRDKMELISAVRKALTMDTGKLAQKYVLANFTLQLREERILKLFEKIFT